MRKEAKRWLRQGEADLKAARDSFKAGNYEWSCFQSQQSAEKSLKSFLFGLGYTSQTTHSIKLLVKHAARKNSKFSHLLEEARVLDAYYIPTRYPNGLDANIAPADYFDQEDAKKCLSCAISILNVAKKYISG